jgi:hypothetical protein
MEKVELSMSVGVIAVRATIRLMNAGGGSNSTANGDVFVDADAGRALAGGHARAHAAAIPAE